MNIAFPKYISTWACTALNTADKQLWLQSIPQTQMTAFYATLLHHNSTNVVTFGRLVIVNKNPDANSFFPLWFTALIQINIDVFPSLLSK